jgi:hypothetical protein
MHLKQMKQKCLEIQEGSASNEKWTEVNKRNRMIMLQRLISANIIADHNRIITINQDYSATVYHRLGLETWLKSIRLILFGQQKKLKTKTYEMGWVVCELLSTQNVGSRICESNLTR